MIRRLVFLALAWPLFACNNGGNGGGGGGGGSGGGGGGPGGGGGGTGSMQTLTVSISGNGQVQSSPAGINCPTQCSTAYAQGTVVTLTANPLGGTFDGWGGACSGTGSCSVTMDTMKNVAANFSGGGGMHTLTVMVNGNGLVASTPGGINNCPTGSCSALFNDGAVVVLAPMAGMNATFQGWAGPCAAGSGNNCNVTVSSDVTVTANFTGGGGSGYTLTVTVAGDGAGTVTSNPAGISCHSGADAGCSFDFGPTSPPVDLTVAADPGSTFAGWSTGGCNGSGYSHTCSFGLNQNGVAVTVYFSGWTLQFPFPVDVRSFAQPGSSLLALGGGASASSPDGVAWAGHAQPGAKLNASAVDPASGTVVAVGSAGAIASSTDQGATWTSRASGVTTDLFGAAFIPPSTFVAVGAGGKIVTADAADVGAWTARSSGTTNDLNAVTWSSTRSVAVAVGFAGTILVSSDGLNWSPKTPSPSTTQFLNGVADGPKGLVAVGSGGTVVSSADGGSWATQTTPVNVTLRAVAANGSGYVATGEIFQPSNDGVVLTSADGLSWTQQPVSADGGSSGNTGLRGENGLALTHWPSAGLFFLGGSSGSVWSSTDGTSWTPSLSPGGHGPPGNGAETDLGVVGYGNGVFVAAGGSNPSIFSSPDALHWTLRRTVACCNPGSVLSIAYGNGTFAAVGGFAGWSVLTSTDGATWGLAGSGGAMSTNLSSVVYAGGKFVAVGTTFAGPSNVGLVVTSTDGITWTEQTNTGVTVPLNSVAYGNGVFVAGGGNSGMGGTVTLYSSPDGVTWTPRNSSISGGYVPALAYGNGTFVGFVDQFTVITSPDGMSWSTHSSGSNLYGNKLVFGQNKFVTDAFWSTTDGVSWSRDPVPEGGQLSALMDTPSGWFGAGYTESFWLHP